MLSVRTVAACLKTRGPISVQRDILPAADPPTTSLRAALRAIVNDRCPPEGPSALRVREQGGSGSFPPAWRFDWVSHSSNEDGFRLYRRQTERDLPDDDGVTTLRGSTTNVVLTSLSGGSYRCHVTAFNENGESPPSNEVAFSVTPTEPDEPDEPDGSVENGFVGIAYRIDLGDGPATDDAFGSVEFTGELLTPADHAAPGSEDFHAVIDWRVPPTADRATPSTEATRLRAGSWRFRAAEPLWLASCEADITAGRNSAINFERGESGCGRGSQFPGD